MTNEELRLKREDCGACITFTNKKKRTIQPKKQEAAVKQGHDSTRNETKTRPRAYSVCKRGDVRRLSGGESSKLYRRSHTVQDSRTTDFEGGRDAHGRTRARTHSHTGTHVDIAVRKTRQIGDASSEQAGNVLLHRKTTTPDESQQRQTRYQSISAIRL